MCQAAAKQARTIPIAQVKGPALARHPWAELSKRLGGKQPDEPLAKAVPADFYFVRAKSFAAWQKQLADHLYRDCPLVLWQCAESESASTPGESESAFRARLAHALREKRDLDLERQRQKYAPKIERLRNRQVKNFLT